MKKIYKIVFLGNTAVGKTTLISQYLYAKVHIPTPTIGIDFLTTTQEINGRVVRLQLWDTAGQEKFHSIIGNYTRNTFLSIIVFAADNMESVEKIETWVNDFVLIHNDRGKTNLMIVANKIDSASKNQEIVEKGKEIASRLDAKFFVASGMTREGIASMVDGINEFIAEDIENGVVTEDEDTNQIMIRARPNRRCC